MALYEHLDKYIRTKKQREFERNFFLDVDQYEIWEEIEIGKEQEAASKFDVTVEDIKFFSEAILDPNPLFNDEDYAKTTPWGGLIAHPLFFHFISLYGIGLGFCNWMRIPGAFNPGQVNELNEPFRPGDLITLKLTSTDKWVKRGWHYVQCQQDFIDQRGVLKVRRWPILSVPHTREEIAKYLD